MPVLLDGDKGDGSKRLQHVFIIVAARLESMILRRGDHRRRGITAAPSGGYRITVRYGTLYTFDISQYYDWLSTVTYGIDSPFGLMDSIHILSLTSWLKKRYPISIRKACYTTATRTLRDLRAKLHTGARKQKKCAKIAATFSYPLQHEYRADRIAIITASFPRATTFRRCIIC